VAKPAVGAPRYVFKFKNARRSCTWSRCRAPRTCRLEREVLLKNAIPYSIAKDDYLASHKAVLLDEGRAPAAPTGAGLPQAPRARHPADPAAAVRLKFGIPAWA
jgi:cell division protease FtsH